MKTFTVLLTSGLLATAGAVNASTIDISELLVIAQEQSNGSMYSVQKSLYTKSFKVSLLNKPAPAKAIELEKSAIAQFLQMANLQTGDGR